GKAPEPSHPVSPARTDLATGSNGGDYSTSGKSARQAVAPHPGGPLPAVDDWLRAGPAAAVQRPVGDLRRLRRRRAFEHGERGRPGGGGFPPARISDETVSTDGRRDRIRPRRAARSLSRERKGIHSCGG